MDVKGTIRLNSGPVPEAALLAQGNPGRGTWTLHTSTSPRLKQTDGLTLLPSGACTESLTHGHMMGNLSCRAAKTSAPTQPVPVYSAFQAQPAPAGRGQMFIRRGIGIADYPRGD